MSYDVKKSAEALSSANCVNCRSMDRLKMMIELDKLMLSNHLRNLSDNVKRGIQFKLQKGEWIGKAPFGYKNITLENGKKNIVLDEAKSHLAKEMFNLCVAGESLSFLSDKFNLSKAIISAILSNPFYYGEMKVKDVLYPHKYPVLISKELFDKCQEVIKVKKKAA